MAPVIAPTAQLTLRHGFLLAAEEPWTQLLSTGSAPWEGKKLDGYSFINYDAYSGGAIVLDGRKFDWNFESDPAVNWPAAEGHPARSRCSWLWRDEVEPAALPRAASRHDRPARAGGTGPAHRRSQRGKVGHHGHSSKGASRRRSCGVAKTARGKEAAFHSSAHESARHHRPGQLLLRLCGSDSFRREGRAGPASLGRRSMGRIRETTKATAMYWRARFSRVAAMPLSPMAARRATIAGFGGMQAAISKCRSKRRTSR